MINKILTFCLSLLAVTAFSLVSAQNTFPSSGNAGIGTTSPTNPLEIQQAGNSLSMGTIDPASLGLKIRRNNDDNTDNAVGLGLVASTASTIVGAAMLFERTGLSSQGKLHFATKNQSGLGGLDVRMTLNEDGKLSVGTLTPTPNGQITVRGNGSGGTIAILPNTSDGETSIGHFSEPDGTGQNWVAGVGGWGNTGDYVIGFSDPTTSGPLLLIQADGNIGIGTSTPANKLDVCGTIRATEIKVESGWCDYVFEEDYLLTSLEEVKKHIAEKGYLHKTPSALEVEQAGGIELASTAVQQQEKIEEIFLHLIELNDRIKNLEKENSELKSRLAND